MSFFISASVTGAISVSRAMSLPMPQFNLAEPLSAPSVVVLAYGLVIATYVLCGILGLSAQWSDARPGDRGCSCPSLWWASACFIRACIERAATTCSRSSRQRSSGRACWLLFSSSTSQSRPTRVCAPSDSLSGVRVRAGRRDRRLGTCCRPGVSTYRRLNRGRARDSASLHTRWTPKLQKVHHCLPHCSRCETRPIATTLF